MTAAALTKRDVAQAAELAEVRAAAAHASAARTWPISVHLTPFAAGCEALRIDSPRRWKTFYGRTVEQAVRATLDRLALAPSACLAAAEGDGDVALMAAAPPELLKLISAKPGEPVPYALFWDGVTADQLKTALADLTGRGWKPRAHLPATA